MVATPSLNRLPNYVDLPLEIKVQIKTETLKQCFLKTEEQSKNIYLKNIEYELKLDNDFKLENIFQQVGLLGLASESNKNVRTTEIDFKPKNPNFTDMKFGNNNNNEVSMRLKYYMSVSLFYNNQHILMHHLHWHNFHHHFQ